MTAAVDHAFELSQSDRFFVGGEWVTPSTSAVINVINGREGGREGLFECLESKTTVLDGEPAKL